MLSSTVTIFSFGFFRVLLTRTAEHKRKIRSYRAF
jgi:hypothetical protein